MNKFWKTLIAVLAIVIAALIVFMAVSSNQKNSVTKYEEKIDESETELLPEIQVEKEYTGYCEIYGKYRQRYVECFGDYDPEVRIKAEAKAKECNESDRAVSGCTSRYQ